MLLKHVYKIIRLTLQLHTMAGHNGRVLYSIQIYNIIFPLNIRTATDYCSANEL